MTSTALSVRVQRRIARSREQLGPLGFAVGAATTAIALLGAGYLVWSALDPASTVSAGYRGKDSERDTGAARRNRPTLSLSLGPNFQRTHSLASLKLLLRLTSAHFLIHLITPPPNGAREDDSTVLSVAELSDALSSIPAFDERRTLEYSTETGRHAIGRALKCNAHVEVLLAASSSFQSNPYADEEVKRYHQEVTRLRKSSGVLVFLLLPVATDEARGASQVATPSRKDIDRLTEPFSAQPGVKIIDLRSSQVDEAWQKGGERLVELAAGWS